MWVDEGTGDWAETFLCNDASQSVWRAGRECTPIIDMISIISISSSVSHDSKIEIITVFKKHIESLEDKK